jgi:hypothetical protein
VKRQQQNRNVSVSILRKNDMKEQHGGNAQGTSCCVGTPGASSKDRANQKRTAREKKFNTNA